MPGKLLVLAFAFLALTKAALGQELVVEQPQAHQPPNVVFIFTDDLGYGDIGAFGATDIATPNIDRVAERGVLFPEFYSASPVCTPSRAALLTGRYPIRMGIHHVFMESSYRGMPQSEITIAETLKEAGYATAIVGKWHLGHQPQYLPTNQGFDEFFGIPYSNDMSPLPLMQNEQYIEHAIDQTELTGRLTTYAVDFIDRHSGEPFFLYMPHPMPHVPLFRSPQFEGVSDRGLYGDVIEELDASVGEIMAALERNDISQNTLLVFTSDNGPWIVMQDEGGSAGPLRNGKGTTFEGGMRVPTVAMLPNLIPAGSEYTAPASMLDWLPTISAFAKVALPQDRVIDGVDLSQSLTAGNTPQESDRPFAYYSHGRLEALRVGDWKLKRPYLAEGNPIPAIMRPFLDGEVALAPHETLLFNLKDDQAEQYDLSGRHPDKVEELEAMMVAFKTRIGDTPENITPIDLTMSPAVGVVISAAAKLGLILVALLTLATALLAFWAGRKWSRR